MKNKDFKDFLFKSAVMAVSCDSENADIEIIEKKMVANEIYFRGYDYEEPLQNNIDHIKANGKNGINQYLQEIVSSDLNEHQEIVSIEVLLRMIESDNDIQHFELKFLQMAKAKLKIDEQTLIVKFPNKIDLLIDFNNYGMHEEFTEEISLK